jgi:uncharacterized DUF497 family protein
MKRWEKDFFVFPQYSIFPLFHYSGCPSSFVVLTISTHKIYPIIMVFDWDDKKNEQLKRERGISFEQIVFLILNDCILDILEHPNKSKYGDQRLYVINVDGYAYIVPFEDRKGVRFLKTIFPSRKYTQKYLRRAGEQR